MGVKHMQLARSSVVPKRNITIVPMTNEEALQKIQDLKRPTSPHLTIYKLPLPAWASITTRVTGVALTAGIYGAGILCAFSSPAELPVYIDAVRNTSPILLPLAKFVVAFPLVYHSFAGVRHIIWDSTSKGLDLQNVYLSTYVLCGGVSVVSLSLAFYSY